MKLSTKGRYGLRALVDIAVYSEEGPVSISAVSKRQNITIRYLEQLLPKLKKAGIIKSIRGAQGGYYLAKPLEDISVGDVLRSLEGDLNLVECSEITGDGKECVGSKYCVTKTVWRKINDSIRETVDSICLKELVEEAKEIHNNCKTER